MKTFLHTFFIFIFLCIKINAQWTLQHEFSGVTGIGSTWAVDENVYWGSLPYTSSNLGYFKTTDGGNSWQEDSVTIAPNSTCIYAKNANTAYMGVSLDPYTWRIIKTTDGGTSWNIQPYPTFGYTSYIDFIYFFDDYNGIILGDPVDIWESKPNSTGYLEVYTTTNSGENWVRVPNAFIPLSDVNEWPIKMVFSVADNTLWVPTYKQSPNMIRIFKSTDRGFHWSISSEVSFSIPGSWLNASSIAFKNQLEGILIASEFYASSYANSNYKMFKTIDGGHTWTEINFPLSIDPVFVCNIPEAPQGYLVTAPINNKGSAYTLDGGTNWQLMEDTLDLSSPQFLSPSVGWAYSWGNSAIYKWTGPPLSAENEIESPNTISLKQNFPNPFNPTTSIEFSLPVAADVQLIVYNVLGQQVAKLINDQRSAGIHSVLWNANDSNGMKLSSGIYFYMLKASGVDGNEFQEIKKMVLLK